MWNKRDNNRDPHLCVVNLIIKSTIWSLLKHESALNDMNYAVLHQSAWIALELRTFPNKSDGNHQQPVVVDCATVSITAQAGHPRLGKHWN